MIATYTDLFKKNNNENEWKSTNIQMNHWTYTLKNIDQQRKKKRKTKQWTEAQYIIQLDVQQIVLQACTLNHSSFYYS